MAVLCPSHSYGQSLTDRLRQVALDNAPFIIQETLNGTQNHEANNHLLKVDFDGDQIGSNNTANADAGNVVDGTATVYYSIAESDDAFFIGYYFYHVRDGGQQIQTPLIDLMFPGHEHDLEGIWVIAEKNSYSPSGVLDFALTQAHGALIPYVDGVFIPTTNGIGASYMPVAGQIHKWVDGVGVARAVVAVRRSTHGTYMAQGVDTSDPYWDYGFGITTDPQSHVAYVHGEDPASAILYYPYPSLCYPSFPCGATRLGPNVNSGAWLYNLVNIAEAPFWPKNQSTDMFSGNLIDIGGGQRALNFFHSSSGSLDANPPWAWTGGHGECWTKPQIHVCWYSFGVDNTQLTGSPEVDWPQIPAGRLLSDPVLVARTFLANINWSSNILFNPFAGSPPPPPPLSVSISGPSSISSCPTDLNTWQAVVSNGTAPYTYQWSGNVSGSATYVVANSTQTDMLVSVDVWDSAGAHATVSLYVTNTGSPCQAPGIT